MSGHHDGSLEECPDCGAYKPVNEDLEMKPHDGCPGEGKLCVVNW